MSACTKNLWNRIHTLVGNREFMELIDTHTHLYAEQFDEDRDEVIKRAIAEGVNRFYLPNIDSTSIQGMFDLEQQYPNQCYPMMGLHPCSVKENVDEELKIVEEWLKKRSFSAIGEIGIDLYWDKTFFEAQKIAFLKQVKWAKSLNLPIIIHSRESIDIIIELLQPEKEEGLRGIFHCFTGTLQQAEAIMDLGFLMGIGGVLTFKKAKLDQVVQHIPLEYLVLETDSPYLAPSPNRGKRNESSYVKLVAKKLAEVKDVSLESLAAITSKNALELFVHDSSAVLQA